MTDPTRNPQQPAPNVPPLEDDFDRDLGESLREDPIEPSEPAQPLDNAAQTEAVEDLEREVLESQVGSGEPALDAGEPATAEGRREDGAADTPDPSQQELDLGLQPGSEPQEPETPSAQAPEPSASGHDEPASVETAAEEADLGLLQNADFIGGFLTGSSLGAATARFEQAAEHGLPWVHDIADVEAEEERLTIVADMLLAYRDSLGDEITPRHRAFLERAADAHERMRQNLARERDRVLSREAPRRSFAQRLRRVGRARRLGASALTRIRGVFARMRGAWQSALQGMARVRRWWREDFNHYPSRQGEELAEFRRNREWARQHDRAYLEARKQQPQKEGRAASPGVFRKMGRRMAAALAGFRHSNAAPSESVQEEALRSAPAPEEADPVAHAAALEPETPRASLRERFRNLLRNVGARFRIAPAKEIDPSPELHVADPSPVEVIPAAALEPEAPDVANESPRVSAEAEESAADLDHPVPGTSQAADEAPEEPGQQERHSRFASLLRDTGARVGRLGSDVRARARGALQRGLLALATAGEDLMDQLRIRTARGDAPLAQAELLRAMHLLARLERELPEQERAAALDSLRGIQGRAQAHLDQLRQIIDLKKTFSERQPLSDMLARKRRRSLDAFSRFLAEENEEELQQAMDARAETLLRMQIEADELRPAPPSEANAIEPAAEVNPTQAEDVRPGEPEEVNAPEQTPDAVQAPEEAPPGRRRRM